MATDIKAILDNLLSFYNFDGKTVVAVGAGGGQLIEYARPARRVIAVDSDARAVETLRTRIRAAGLDGKCSALESDFEEVTAGGDVVLFEFCLHEMANPCRCLRRARRMAKDVVVIDHLPDSEWSFYAAEEDKVRSGWDAVHVCQARIRAVFQATQRFRDYAELLEKVQVQGEESVRRIQPFLREKEIVLRMPYGIALL
jgi:ubiquinone/menaquinone biosynthesis C-methylase UbiE